MTLFDKLVKKSNLYSAWKLLQKNPSSHGIDGVTIKDFQSDLDKNITTLRRVLLDKSFSFKPLRGRLIDKDGGKKRPLKIPAVADRVVQRAIRNVIEKYLKKFNLPCSYGYIEKKSREHAVEKIIYWRDKKYGYVLEADIKDFFNVVSQEILVQKINAVLPDNSINYLIQDALSAEIGNQKEFSKEEIAFFPDGSMGIPQGGILSPLFANLYLSDFDKKMLEDGFKLIRYADDFVVLCKSQEEALNAYKLAKEFLKNQLLLEIHEIGVSGSKTKVTHFSQGFDFLGFSFNHSRICPNEKTRNKFKGKAEEILNPKSLDNLIDVLFRLRNMMNGWGNAYSFCHSENIRTNPKDDTMIKIFESAENHVQTHFFKLLNTCEIVPREKTWRGIHLKKFGVPKLADFLLKRKLLDITRKRKKNTKLHVKNN